MTISDILLGLNSYPDPTPDSSIDAAVGFAAALGARMTAVTFESDVRLSKSPGLLSSLVLDLPQMVKEEASKSLANAKHLQDYFKASATRQRVAHDVVHCKSPVFEMPQALAEHGRLHDLTIMPLQDVHGIEQWHAEAVVFGTGRPTLLLPGPALMKDPPSLRNITVAWDFSHTAARALADAIPLLQRAEKVHVVTVRNEKAITSKHSHRELAQHLKSHDIAITFDDIDARGRSAAETLDKVLLENRSTMLVMGAYGHSRVREFVLGGMTRSVLDNPRIPVFLSH